MKAQDLLEALLGRSNVEGPPDEGFYAESLSLVAPHLLGIDSSGRFCILLALQESCAAGVPLSLEGFEVRHDVLCRIHKSAPPISLSGRFSIIRCMSRQAEDLSIVANLAMGLWGNHGQTCPSRVNEIISRVASIFRSRPTKQNDEVGLWRELFVLLSARSPDNALSSWQTHDDRTYDFASDAYLIEVKTTTSRRMVHSFTLSQVKKVPEEQRTRQVMSISLRQNAQGLTVNGLIDAIASSKRYSEEALVRMRAEVFARLGDLAKHSTFTNYSPADSVESIKVRNLDPVTIDAHCLGASVIGAKFQVDVALLPASIPMMKLTNIGGCHGL